MSKTTACDICGKTFHQYVEEGKMVALYNFKRKGLLGTLGEEDNFDICSECLKKIREERRKENG